MLDDRDLALLGPFDRTCVLPPDPGVDVAAAKFQQHKWVINVVHSNVLQLGVPPKQLQAVIAQIRFSADAGGAGEDSHARQRLPAAANRP